MCSFPGCDKSRKARDLCVGHYSQQRRGNPLKPLGESVTNPARKGTPWLTWGGYEMVAADESPFIERDDGRILVHRLVMAEAIGRKLRPDEQVHHINGNKRDNRLENLELWTTAHPAGQRVEDKIEWAVGILSLYRPELLHAEGASYG